MLKYKLFFIIILKVIKLPVLFLRTSKRVHVLHEAKFKSKL
jgi:hypothetical protein